MDSFGTRPDIRDPSTRQMLCFDVAESCWPVCEFLWTSVPADLGRPAARRLSAAVLDIFRFARSLMKPAGR